MQTDGRIYTTLVHE